MDHYLHSLGAGQHAASSPLDIKTNLHSSPSVEYMESEEGSLKQESKDKIENRIRTGTVTTAGRYLEHLSNPQLSQPKDTNSASIQQGRVLGTSNTDLSQVQMGKFLSGFKRFRKTYFASNTALFDSLKKAQKPKTVLLGCCDSRVDPAILTDCDPGDLFVIRNVANLVAPYGPDSGYHGVASALEFAVLVLGVENIIVLGHSKCGGISALLRGVSPDFEFIAPWVSIAQQAKEKTLKYFGDRSEEEQQRACEHASILQTIENLVTYPWIKDRLQAGQLNLTGWYFDFESGDLLGYNPESLNFEPLVQDEHPERATSARSTRASAASTSPINRTTLTADEHARSPILRRPYENIRPKSD
ncbi:hypothetical protein QVD99_005693 [Batrachochytrium dendrobatidis]|nr:hypothetical protein O5D80_000829 [Batrachochytrium dendrobatidis]KAK5667575.1 hypothetical protein QVD99_005693 [Batrachochytrium dendrobatidis]OAJ44402.1 carbonic anhydrase [Batrachochytrium dendrobatidis JEL423]